MNNEKELEKITNLFKSLSHISRLLIFNILKNKSCSGEELASILNLTPATISHHLTMMIDSGLILIKKESYSNSYQINKEIANKNLIDLAYVGNNKIENKTDDDAFKNKVIYNFFNNGRLIKYPSQKKKQAIVLEKISENLDPDKKYSEKELSIFLYEYYDDFATLRRGMVEHKIMNRENGFYYIIKE